MPNMQQTVRLGERLPEALNALLSIIVGRFAS
jgi:hypothetical protein